MCIRDSIRAIARDLGEILNSEGCLLQLKRTSACGFDEQNSIKISDMEKETRNITYRSYWALRTNFGFILD